MIPISREISDLKAEFEGGSSFSVDWYVLLRKGSQNVLDHINPETLKRTVPIYGGLTRNLRVYYCPEDVEVPSRLYTNDRKTYFDFVPPAQFYARHNFLMARRNKFTIEYVNGVRFIVVYHPSSELTLTLDQMDSPTGATGNVTLALNTYNVLPGASASLQGTFTDALTTIGRVLDTPLDISDVLRGVAIVPVYMDSADKLASLKLRLYTGDRADGNYYDVITTQDSVGDYLRDGQNMVRFWLNNATPHGTPDPTNVTEYEIIAPQETGESQTLIFGKLTLQASHLFFLEYYSNRMFIDGTTGAWKETPEAGDSINLNRDAAGILHYETCRLTVQAAAFDRVDSEESKRFDTELSRKYQQYYDRHPSSEQPLSYNISPDIPYSPAIFGEVDMDLPEMIGESANAEESSAVYFVDAETPVGAIDGVNMVYTLSHTPDPADSLVLDLNGTIAMGAAGQLVIYNYTLVGKTLTFDTPIDASFSSLPFTASYRHRGF